MSKQSIWTLAVVAALSALLTVAVAQSGAPSVDPSSYPEIGDVEMAQLRWSLKLADRDVDDFSNLAARDQFGMTAYRYLIAFTTYFIGVEQYEKVPAWPEMGKSRIDRLIAKMIQKPVWEYWAEVSKGVPKFEPKFNRPYPSEHDPVGKKNIMYSGHLGHMTALFETLYRDLKWSEAGSMTFAWDEKEKFVYDNNSLQKLMYDQMANNPWHSIECEPNLCFPECNQHPLLSFMLYDSVHGTKYSEAKEWYSKFFDEQRTIHPKTHETAAFYLVKQKKTLRVLSIGSSAANGWTGAFMHAWRPDFIEKHYPEQRDGHVTFTRKGDAKLDRDFGDGELQYGFFAMYAAEVGDYETRDKLLRRADKMYSPVSEDGLFHYPPSVEKKCTNLTDKLIGIARALSKNSLFNLHNKPFDEAHFREPYITGVDFPKVLVRRAIWDRDKLALIVTLDPTTVGAMSFVVKNLSPAKTYDLVVGGKSFGKVSGVAEREISLDLAGKTDVVLVEVR